MRNLGRRKHGPARFDPDKALFSKPRKQLDEEEGAATRALRHLQQPAIWLCEQHIPADLRDPCLVKGTENDLLRPLALQAIYGAPKLARSLARAKRDDPADRDRCQPGRQRSESGSRPVVGPLQVIEAHEKRRLERGFLQQCFQVLHQPISLLGRRVLAAQGGTLEERLTAVEQGFHQGGQLDYVVTGVSSAAPNPDRPWARHGQRLFEQPALAQSRGSLDHNDRTDAGKQLVEVASYGCEVVVAAANRLSGLHFLRSSNAGFHCGLSE